MARHHDSRSADPRPLDTPIVTPGYRIHRCARSDRRGFGLVEILVLLGLMAFAAQMFNRLFVFNLRSQKHLELKGELESARRFLLEALSCEKSFAGENSCSLKEDGTVLEGPLVNHAGTALSPRVGDWTIRASCRGGLPELQAARLNGKDAQKKDRFMASPLVANLSEWRPLFPSGASPCQGTRPYVSCHDEFVISAYGTSLPTGRYQCESPRAWVSQCFNQLSPSGDAFCHTQVNPGAGGYGSYCVGGGCDSREGQRWQLKITCCEQGEASTRRQVFRRPDGSLNGYNEELPNGEIYWTGDPDTIYEQYRAPRTTKALPWYPAKPAAQAK